MVERQLLLLMSSYCKCCGEERARQERVPAIGAGEAMAMPPMAIVMAMRRDALRGDAMRCDAVGAVRGNAARVLLLVR